VVALTGAAIVGVLPLGESATPWKVAGLSLIGLGIAGLKLRCEGPMPSSD
jgi:multidrug transporter EmrE-like cation transporter